MYLLIIFVLNMDYLNFLILILNLCILSTPVLAFAKPPSMLRGRMHDLKEEEGRSQDTTDDYFN
jgi:hypothetical protein